MDYARYIVLPAFDNEWSIDIRTESGTTTKVYR